MPRSGITLLTTLLQQNPRFVAQNNGPAQAVFAHMVEELTFGSMAHDKLDDAQKTALLRGSIDAIYHDRPLDSVVFDANPAWLPRIDRLVRIYPLCRFIVCVRNPAAIVNSILFEDGISGDKEISKITDSLMAESGAIGEAVDKLRDALSSGNAERILVLDYDRLVDDPDDAIDVIYDFLREEEFPHNVDNLGGSGSFDGPIRRLDYPKLLSTRMILQLSGKAFWRNLKRSAATMLLGRAR